MVSGHTLPRSCRFAVLCLLAVGLFAPTAAQAAEKVDVSVWTIRATRRNKDISPQLKSLAGKLKKSFKFTGYKLEKTDSRAVELDKEYGTSLIGNYRAKITPTGKSDKQVKLKVVVTHREGRKEVKKLSTTLNLAPGRVQRRGGG